MDTRPIGVFDSGLGGLTTVKKLRQLLPHEDIIYLGDTGRVPYGSRSKDTIIKYASQGAAFLSSFDIKVMVIACNTACSHAFEILDKTYKIPVYEVIGVPAQTAAQNTKNGKIGVLGTAATIRSRAYETAIKKLDPELTVYSEACPLFVPLVENGLTGEDDIAVLSIAERYLATLRKKKIDTLILGCTHYPLLRGVIAKIMGPEVALVDSGAETAKLVAGDISAGRLHTPSGSDGAVAYYVTDAAEGFAEMASRFMESDIRGTVEQITLE